MCTFPHVLSYIKESLCPGKIYTDELFGQFPSQLGDGATRVGFLLHLHPYSTQSFDHIRGSCINIQEGLTIWGIFTQCYLQLLFT